MGALFLRSGSSSSKVAGRIVFMGGDEGKETTAARVWICDTDNERIPRWVPDTL